MELKSLVFDLEMLYDPIKGITGNIKWYSETCV